MKSKENFKKHGFTQAPLSTNISSGDSKTVAPIKVTQKTRSVKSGAGFTLIELLVVIAIIGLLASVVLLALNGARAKARDAKRISDMTTMASALELYFNDNNSYPPSSLAGMTPTYVGQIPSAPTPYDAGTGGCTATNNSYVYTPNGSAPYASYTYTFCLGNTVGRYPPGPHTLTSSGIQ
jgi:prepilin-type N-terminal cleavage/methylation domain-containing protein